MKNLRLSWPPASKDACITAHYPTKEMEEQEELLTSPKWEEFSVSDSGLSESQSITDYISFKYSRNKESQYLLSFKFDSILDPFWVEKKDPTYPRFLVNLRKEVNSIQGEFSQESKFLDMIFAELRAFCAHAKDICFPDVPEDEFCHSLGCWDLTYVLPIISKMFKLLKFPINKQASQYISDNTKFKKTAVVAANPKTKKAAMSSSTVKKGKNHNTISHGDMKNARIRDFSKQKEDVIDMFHAASFRQLIRSHPDKKAYFSQLLDSFTAENGKPPAKFVKLCYSPAAKVLLNANWSFIAPSSLADLKTRSYFYFRDCRSEDAVLSSVVSMKDGVLYLYGYPIDKEKLLKNINSAKHGVVNPCLLTELSLIEDYYACKVHSGYYLAHYVIREKPYWTSPSFIRGMTIKSIPTLKVAEYNLYLDSPPPADYVKRVLNPTAAEFVPRDFPNVPTEMKSYVLDVPEGDFVNPFDEYIDESTLPEISDFELNEPQIKSFHGYFVRGPSLSDFTSDDEIAESGTSQPVLRPEGKDEETLTARTIKEQVKKEEAVRANLVMSRAFDLPDVLPMVFKPYIHKKTVAYMTKAYKTKAYLNSSANLSLLPEGRDDEEDLIVPKLVRSQPVDVNLDSYPNKVFYVLIRYTNSWHANDFSSTAPLYSLNGNKSIQWFKNPTGDYIVSISNSLYYIKVQVDPELKELEPLVPCLYIINASESTELMLQYAHMFDPNEASDGCKRLLSVANISNMAPTHLSEFDIATNSAPDGSFAQPLVLPLDADEAIPEMYYTSRSVLEWLASRGHHQCRAYMHLKEDSVRRLAGEGSKEFFDRILLYHYTEHMTYVDTPDVTKIFKEKQVQPPNGFDYSTSARPNPTPPIPAAKHKANFIEELVGVLGFGDMLLDEWMGFFDFFFIIYRFLYHDKEYLQNLYVAHRFFPTAFTVNNALLIAAVKTGLDAFLVKKSEVEQSSSDPKFVVESFSTDFYSQLFLLCSRFSLYSIAKYFNIFEFWGFKGISDFIDATVSKDVKDLTRNNFLKQLITVLKSGYSLIKKCIEERSFDPLFMTSRTIDDIFFDIKYITSYEYAHGEKGSQTFKNFHADLQKGSVMMSPRYLDLLTDEEALGEIGKLRAELDQFHSDYPNYSAFLINTHHALLNSKEMVLRQMLTSMHRRIPAYCIRLYGPPMVGKSHLVDELISLSHVAIGGNGLLGDRAKHTINFGSKHFDGCSPGVFAVVLDDVDHSQTNTEGVDMLAKTIAEAVNCTVWRPPMADLSQKGISIAPALLLQTTNIPDGGISRAVIDQARPAYERRISMHVHLKVLKEYASLTKGVDEFKVAREGLKFTDVVRYDVSFYRGETERAREIHKDLTITQLAMLYTRDFLAYRERKAKAESSVNERCPKCLLKMDMADHQYCADFQVESSTDWLFSIFVPRVEPNNSASIMWNVFRKMLAPLLLVISISFILLLMCLVYALSSSLLWCFVTFNIYLLLLHYTPTVVSRVSDTTVITTVRRFEDKIKTPWKDYIKRFSKDVNWEMLKKAAAAAAVILTFTYAWYTREAQLATEGSFDPVIVPKKEKTKVTYPYMEGNDFSSKEPLDFRISEPYDFQARLVWLKVGKEALNGYIIGHGLLLTMKHLFLPHAEDCYKLSVSGEFSMTIRRGEYSNVVKVTQFFNYPGKDLVAVRVADLPEFVKDDGKTFAQRCLPDNVSLKSIFGKVCIMWTNDKSARKAIPSVTCTTRDGGSPLLAYAAETEKGDCGSVITYEGIPISVHTYSATNNSWRYGEIIKRGDIERAIAYFQEFKMLHTEGVLCKLDKILPRTTTISRIPDLSNLSLSYSACKHMNSSFPYNTLFHDDKEVSFSHSTNLVPDEYFLNNEKLEAFFNKYHVSMNDFAPAKEVHKFVTYDGVRTFYETPYSKNLLASSANSVTYDEWVRAIATFLDFRFEDMEPLQPLSDYETLKGNEYLNHLNTKSSGGQGFGKNSENFDFSKGDPIATKEILDEMHEIIKSAEDGYLPVTVSKRQLKDELKTRKQVEEGKIRIFSVTQVPFILASRKMLGPLIKIMRVNWKNMMTTLGYDLSDSWNKQILEFLGFFDKDLLVGFLALDAKNFDLNGDCLMIAMVAFMIAVILFFHGYTWKQAQAAGRIFWASFYALHNIKGDYFMAAHILSSGMFHTFIFNCIKSALAYIIAYYRLVKQNNWGYSSFPYYSEIKVDKDFRKNFSGLFCGDDAFAKIAKHLEHVLTQTAIKEALKDVFPVQPEQKDQEMLESLSFDQCSFMKRKFQVIRHGEHVMHVSPLEITSLAKSLSHYDSKMKEDLNKYRIDMEEFFLREMFHHGQEKYEEARRCFSKVYPSWEERIPEFLKPGFQTWA